MKNVWGLFALAVCMAGQAAERPNVLLLLVDDLKPALGCYGDSAAISPNIDDLASRGMRFDLAYCNQAVCAPSRFTLMLGSHSTSTGLYGLGSQMRELVPDAVTLPQFFQRHGYRTESLGKIFHIGHGNSGDPISFSVPHHADRVVEYLDPASTNGGQLTREEALFTNQKLDRIRSLPRGAAFESPVAADDDYADGRTAAATIERLRAAKDRRRQTGTPFFIAAGFVRPHLPFCAPKKYWDLFDPDKLPMPQIETPPQAAPQVAIKRGGEIKAYKPVPEQGEISHELKRQLIHGYYASTAYVDVQIGKVLKALDDLNLSDNTIIVLWGDHGWHLGDLGIWTKHTNYEQANRIPLLIVAPNVTPSAGATRQLAESVDVYPTLAELAGLPQPAGPQSMDGKSLVPVLRDPKTRVRDHAFHAYPRGKLGRAIRTERYRLVQWLNPGEAPSSAEYELYDYSESAIEVANIAAEHPDVVTRLREILEQYPAPVSRSRRGAAASIVIPTPEIAGKRIRVSAIIRGDKPNGVIVAQGGNQHGYALYLRDGFPVLDVRARGVVTSLKSRTQVSGRAKIKAIIREDELTLFVDGEFSRVKSPGLITVQPKDELSVGEDSASAAGNYQAPNPFSGRVENLSVTTSNPE